MSGPRGGNRKAPLKIDSRQGVFGPLSKLRFLFAELPEEWRWASTIWLITRLVLSSWGAVLWALDLIPTTLETDFYFGVEPIAEGWTGILLGVWQRWDGIHFIRIAERGYSDADLSVFFPLYPLTARLLSRLTGAGSLMALLIISNLASCFAWVVLYRIVKADLLLTTARRAVVAYALFPTGFFLFAPYPESLSLLLVLLAYWSALCSRWRLVAATSLAAGLTRPTIFPLILLLGPIAWRYWRANESSDRWLALASVLGAGFGMGGFLAWRVWAGFPAYSLLQRQHWTWAARWPWQAFLAVPEWIVEGSFSVAGWLGLGVLLLLLAATVWGLRHLPKEMVLYQASMLLFLLSFSRQIEPLASLGRHALLMFPLFVALAAWSQTSQRTLFLAAIGVGLGLFFVGQFIMWGWVG